MWKPLDNPDGVVQVALPILGVIGYLLERLGLPARVVPTLVGVINLGLYAALVAALIRVRRLAVGRRMAFVLGMLAVALLGWIATHPVRGFEIALVRGDHLMLAAFGGAALRVLPTRRRVGVLIGTSVVFLVLMAGPAPVAVVLAGLAVAVMAERLAIARGVGRAATFAQMAILLATLGACRVMWGFHWGLGLTAQGLFGFMLLRHVSWIVDVRRGAGGSVLDYWCYQLFYPCCYGATERYADFRERNPDLGTLIDDTRLFRSAVRSAVYLWLAMWIPYDPAALLAAPSWPALAGGYLVMFVGSALLGMGVWSGLEAVALCWGVRIHPNFAGILAARSPSQFWYAWRGTMTRWLVEYVYIPLGGNRAHQVRNVFAVFAVSATWHWMGIPFLRTQPTPVDFLPIGSWALVNAVVLAGALTWRRRGWRVWPAMTLGIVRTTTARFGTWVLGGVTATFLAFQGELAPRFPEFVLRFVGVH